MDTGYTDLISLIPIIRGLLAEPTGNDDKPFKSVILKPTQGVTKNTLRIETIDPAGDPEKNKKQIIKAIHEYQDANKVKPEAIHIKNLGTLSVLMKSTLSEFPLANKVALVTGAAGAIGYGICQGLLENGCYVAVSDLAGDKLGDFTVELKKAVSDRVIGIGMDVTDEESVKDGIRNIVQAWGGIDIVVVNAGIAHVSRLKEMSLEAFRKLEKVNVEGTLLTLRESGRHFAVQGTGGDIIIISTKNVPAPGVGFGAYSATKAACHQLGRLASLEFAEYGVRVNMVAPDAVFAEGKFKSGLWQEVGPDRMKARGLDEKGLQEYYRQRNLLKIRVTGRHVANAVLFFATRQTPTTGATIPVDGGLPDATLR